MRQYYPLMAANGDPGGSDPPDYKVYRSGKGGGGQRGKGRGGRPEYRVYRSRPKLLGRLRAPDLSSLRDRMRRQEKPGPERRRGRPAAEPERPRRRWLRWVLIAVGGWILLSLVVFGVSAQIQKSKLNNGAANELGGNPFLLASPQTILVMGTDAREAGTQDGSETSRKCLDEGAAGDPPGEGCPGFRADTLLLVRAGGGTFRKLSIPRDTFAEVPGQVAQKINGAYSAGGAKLQIQAVENLLGIDIDHAVIVDFEGFSEFIDAIGGVEVDLGSQRICSEISGGEDNGGFSLDVGPGEVTLSGDEALIVARTRNSDCDGDGISDDNFNDLDRARTQQLILSGIKGRLTSPFRLPYNFIKGPWIAWAAPKAFVSDMGALTMPQLVLSAVIGGDAEPAILEPSGAGPGGSLIIPVEECRQAVEKLLGKEGPEEPVCSPGAAPIVG